MYRHDLPEQRQDWHVHVTGSKAEGIVEYQDRGHKAHRLDGPARTEYDRRQDVSSESWLIHGDPHRVGAPARIEYHPGGQRAVKSEQWLFRGAFHREDGPALTSYDIDGRITREAWYLSGKMHSPDGITPSLVEYAEEWNGKPSRRAWHRDGGKHRIGGPADEHLMPDGSMEMAFWYLHGEIADSALVMALSVGIAQENTGAIDVLRSVDPYDIEPESPIVLLALSLHPNP